MSSQSQITAALGRLFDLGMLYDRRSGKLILGKALSSPDHPSQAVETITKSNQYQLKSSPKTQLPIKQVLSMLKGALNCVY